MRILKKSFQLTPNQTNYLAKLFPLLQQPKLHFHTNHLKPPTPNQTLKSYLHSSTPTKALLLFANLLKKNTCSIDSYSLLFVIKACTKKPLPFEGKQLHCIAIKLGYEPTIYLQTSLIQMYSRSGYLSDAQLMFDAMPIKNVVSWTSLISAYVDNHKPNKAIQLFRQMQMSNVDPDQVTVTVALSACADLGALDVGEWIHGYVRRNNEMKPDLCLNNALINMYAKCGDIETAKALFDGVKNKDVTTWTSMIVGYALHGQAEEALQLFAAMIRDDANAASKKKKRGRGNPVIVPNDVTFIGVLMACSHAGKVEEGKQHLRSMTEVYGLKPRLSHFGCIVDLLCRAGLLQEAYEFVMAMPVQPNAVVWRTLLGACSVNGNVELATKAHRHLLEMEKRLAGDDVVLSNAYAGKEMWDTKVSIRQQIKWRRTPGCTSIEVESGIGEFVSDADEHPFGYVNAAKK